MAAEAIAFDTQRAGAYPCPGVVLLKHGHYVAVVDRSADRFEIYDPSYGWTWVSWRKFSRQLTGFGVEVAGGAGASPPQPGPSRRHAAWSAPWRLLRGRLALGTLGAFAAAQAITLALPLLSAASVDRATEGLNLGTAGWVAVAFVALSATSTVTSLVGQLLSHRLGWRAARALGRENFETCAAQSSDWFEANRPVAIQNRIASREILHSFALECLRSAGALVVALTAGTVVLFYISPWLALPSLLSLALTVAIELGFNRWQLSQAASVLEAAQRRQAFTLDILSQIPLLRRHHALKHARRQYANVVGRAAAAAARLQSIKRWRSLLTGAVRSLETLAFVSLGAYFMSQGDYSLGAFVALGAYKDLLAGSLSSLFQLRQRSRTLEVHRLQAEDFGDGHLPQPSCGGRVIHGEVKVERVSYAYGSLDRPVLEGVSLEVTPGEFVALRGPSGAGKSTFARLLSGDLTPCSGSVRIDGAIAAPSMTGFAAVLQGDRLIPGTIRDNVVLFRPGVDDQDVWEALHLAAINEFVAALPMRLNTPVGDAIGGLSGGQKQRLLIARAVLQRPRLLVLDEATASLDVGSETEIFRGLRALGITIVAIAHRPEVWSIADRVIDFGAGRRERPLAAA